jgi:predicted branched-subunit amino acid permease
MTGVEYAMTGTLVLSLAASGIYCVIAVFFLIFSMAELAETRNRSRLSAALAVAAALFWPVALAAASVSALVMRPPRRSAGSRPLRGMQQPAAPERLAA